MLTRKVNEPWFRLFPRTVGSEESKKNVKQVTSMMSYNALVLLQPRSLQIITVSDPS